MENLHIKKNLVNSSYIRIQRPYQRLRKANRLERFFLSNLIFLNWCIRNY